MAQARTPRDDKGRFVPRDCDACDAGRLQPEGDGYWRCDGLADPGHPNLPLAACDNHHVDGHPRIEA